ncbi:MAG: CPBP family intramembrane glutamic endopeptidase [Chloroflexota bacterium]
MPERGTFTLQTFFGATTLFSAMMVSVLVAAHLWARWLGYNGLGFIGLNSRFGSGVLGLILGVGAQTVSFGMLSALGWLQLQGVNFSGQAIINVALLTLSSLNAAVVEEAVFRGVLYSVFRPRWGWWRTALITAIVFALPHFLTNTYTSFFSAGLGLLIGGVLFAWAREIGKSLWLPMGIHFGWNAAIGWLNLAAGDTPHLLITKLNGPAWAVGNWVLNDWALLVILALSLLAVTFKARGAG